jgi:hypothetical protein
MAKYIGVYRIGKRGRAWRGYVSINAKQYGIAQFCPENWHRIIWRSEYHCALARDEVIHLLGLKSKLNFDDESGEQIIYRKTK